MKLEIGGGTLCSAGWENLDPTHGSRPEFKVRVQDGIPLPDSSVDHARASHVLEHIPSGEERVKAMNEVHRVLKPSGTFEIILPLIGHTDPADGSCHTVNNWRPWADPTHVSHWWFPESLLYFCDENPIKANADYGVRIWARLRPEDWEVRDGWEGRALLRKKP